MTPDNKYVPKLLRAIANGSDAEERHHDIIFNAAADEIERLRAALEGLVAVFDAEAAGVAQQVTKPERVAAARAILENSK